MPKNRWKSTLTALLLCADGSQLSAASNGGYSVTSWGAEETIPEKRLPQKSVFALLQTRDGYLWAGTGGGLARFDGLHFRTFDANNTPELKDTRVLRLFEDSRQNLWIGTEAGGVVMVKDGKFTNVNIGQDATRHLVAICEDSVGGIWLNIANEQLYRYREGKLALILNGCRALASDDAGHIWVGTAEGRLFALGPIPDASAPALPVAYEVPPDKAGQLDLILSSRKGGYWRLGFGSIQKWKADHRELQLGAYPWSEGVRISAACEDAEGNLVVATYGEGVYWFDAAGKFTHLQGLSHSFIYSLTMDREGDLWVGTDGTGINRVKKQVFDVLEQSRRATVQSVCEDKQGGLWYAINNGGVGYLKDGKLQQFKEAQGLANLYVRSVFVDHEENVWAGTEGGLYRLDHGLFRQALGLGAANLEVSAIFEDRHHLLWIGTRAGLACRSQTGWKVFTTRDGLSSGAVRAIAEDADGNLWIGTKGGGVDCLRNGKFSHFSRTNGLPTDNVSSLYADENGVLWAGTSGGLGRLEAGKWTRFSKPEGLIDSNVGYLAEDHEGHLWLGSTAGLIRVEKKALNAFAHGATNALRFRAYGQADGLPSDECTSGSQPAACIGHDGKLWFPTIQGVASLEPTLLRRNTNLPPVLIEAVRIDGQLQNSDALRARPPDSLTVPPGKEAIQIDYTGLNFSAPEQGRFRYRMRGYETAWTETAADIRSARYPRLPPGDYHFQVIGCNEDWVWNEAGSSLTIKVLPPYWRTWWFRGLITLSLLGMTIGSVHYVSTQKLHRQLESLRQQEALEKERARIARDLHDQLGANLTQVALLGELAETDKDLPEEVESHARQISQTARETTHALDEIVWTVNPSNDTLDGLVNYVCKYAQEYLALAGLRYRLEVPPELPATPIAPELRHNVFLAAKESVNNIVKHAQASSAWLRLRLDADHFELEIEDDGRGLPANAADKGRNGLGNMRKRMRDIGGDFEIGPRAEGGTKVKLSAPLRSEPR